MLEISWSDLVPFLAVGIVVADASVAVRGDLSKFHQDLKGAERGTATLGQRLRDALSPKNIIAGAGLLGIGLGIRQLVGYAGEAAAAFSDLQQTTRTVDAVFGDSADVIHAWGETAAQAAGLSKREVNEAAAVMGQTLLNMGFSAEEAADKVVQLQQRAADLALAFGKDPQDAILAITAAMRGERDTIEKFGVSIKQADVNSRVLALGLDTSTTASKKNAEAMAILDIILSQSASSADRFAQSQDDVAVKLAQNQARIENLNATIGQEVASIQLGAVKVGDALTSYFDTASHNIDAFLLNFGSQHVEILRLADEAGITYEAMKQRIIAAMDLTGLSFPDVVASFSVEGAALSDLVEAEYMGAALAAGAGVAAMANQISLGGPVVAAEAGKIAGMLPSEIRAQVENIRNAGGASVVAFAAGIIAKQNDPKLAWEAALEAANTVLTREEEIAFLKGALASEEYAAGVTDQRDGVSAAFQAFGVEADRRLRAINAFGYGYNTGSSYASGLWAAVPLVEGAARGIASATGRQIGIRSEPEAPDSPLRGITQWGGNIVKTLAEGMLGQLSTASAASNALAGALSPSLAMSPVAMGTQGGSAAPGLGTTIINNHNLSVNGVPYEVSSPEEMIDALVKLGVGELP